jgi:hypothetical protein
LYIFDFVEPFGVRPYRASFHFFVIISTNIWAALPIEKAAEQQNICSQ